MHTSLKEDLKTIWKDLKTDIPKFFLISLTDSWFGFILFILLLIGIAVWAGWHFAPALYSL